MKGLSARTVKRTLKGKSRVKQEYLINIQMIKGLESVENQEFYVEWKRGDKAENKGKFEKDIVKNGKLVFSPSLEIKLNCTLFVGKDGKYEEKPIAFSLHSTNKKSKDPVFKGKMNLAEFTDYTDEKPIELKLVGKKNSGILLLLIKSGYAGEGDSMDETEIMISEDVESQPKDVLDLLVSQQATNHSSKLSKEINDDNVIENNKDMINTEDIKKDDEIVNNDENEHIDDIKEKKEDEQLDKEINKDDDDIEKGNEENKDVNEEEEEEEVMNDDNNNKVNDINEQEKQEETKVIEVQENEKVKEEPKIMNSYRKSIEDDDELERELVEKQRRLEEEKRLREESFSLQREESFKLPKKGEIKKKKEEKMYSTNELMKIISTKTKEKTKQLNQLNTQLEKIDSYDISKKLTNNEEINQILQKKELEKNQLKEKNDLLQQEYNQILEKKTKEAHENILVVSDLLNIMKNFKGKFDENKSPILANKIHQIIAKDIQSNVEVPALNILKIISFDSTDDALYYLLTILLISGNSLKPSKIVLEHDGSFITQMQILFNNVFMKYVFSITGMIKPFINASLFGKRSVLDASRTDFEDLCSQYVVKQLRSIRSQLEQYPSISQLLIHQIYTQIFHSTAYLIIDTLLNHPEFVNLSKGFQIKYFASFIKRELKKTEPEMCNSYWSFFEPVLDVANLLVLSISSMKILLLDDVEIQTTFSSLPLSLIHAIIKILMTEEGPVPNEIIESIHEKILETDIPNSNTIVA